MRAVLQHLKDYVAEHARPVPYLLTALLLLAGFWINYGLGFKTTVLQVYRENPANFGFYLLFYAVPYVGTLLIVTLGTPEVRVLRDRAFWAACAFLLVVLAANRLALRLPSVFIDGDGLTSYETWYWRRCLVNGVRLVALGGPAWIFWRLFQRDLPHFYGLQRSGFHWRPYLIMLGLMIPPVVWASFLPAFQKVYPICRPEVLERVHGWPSGATYALHEFFYALRFIGVEIFFRGFLVLGMVRWLGRAVLLPMVALYAFWHFGKPFPEALGSVFGAYVLGILALRTRSINGGILIHMGIALSMNLAAYAHYLLR